MLYIPISRPPRVIRRFKRRSCMFCLNVETDMKFLQRLPWRDRSCCNENWYHNRLLMMSQWPDNCDRITWIMIFNSLDIDFIHGVVHGRSCQNSGYLITHHHQSLGITTTWSKQLLLLIIQKGISCKMILFFARLLSLNHDDVIKWKHFPRYWPFVWRIHRSPVNSPHKGQWRGVWCFLWSTPE